MALACLLGELILGRSWLSKIARRAVSLRAAFIERSIAKRARLSSALRAAASQGKVRQ
jgi:hypothetical protein